MSHGWSAPWGGDPGIQLDSLGRETGERRGRSRQETGWSQRLGLFCFLKRARIRIPEAGCLVPAPIPFLLPLVPRSEQPLRSVKPGAVIAPHPAMVGGRERCGQVGASTGGWRHSVLFNPLPSKWLVYVNVRKHTTSDQARLGGATVLGGEGRGEGSPRLRAAQAGGGQRLI